MIVKGHDFPQVTVVGNILADLSLFDTDYESAERTFDLLTQAAGRAGRGEVPGQVVVQTYQPEHYAITAAASQDYKGFYEYEMSYRKLLHYPPYYHLLGVCIISTDESFLSEVSEKVAGEYKSEISASDKSMVEIIGPADAFIYKINNEFRKVIYIKSMDYSELNKAAEILGEIFGRAVEDRTDIEIQFDFNPMRII